MRHFKQMMSKTETPPKKMVIDDKAGDELYNKYVTLLPKLKDVLHDEHVQSVTSSSLKFEYKKQKESALALLRARAAHNLQKAADVR